MNEKFSQTEPVPGDDEFPAVLVEDTNQVGMARRIGRSRRLIRGWRRRLLEEFSKDAHLLSVKSCNLSRRIKLSLMDPNGEEGTASYFRLISWFEFVWLVEWIDLKPRKHMNKVLDSCQFVVKIRLDIRITDLKTTNYTNKAPRFVSVRVNS